jgi:tetratricopeptide (TPR) repeat protein
MQSEGPKSVSTKKFAGIYGLVLLAAAGSLWFTHDRLHDEQPAKGSASAPKSFMDSFSLKAKLLVRPGSTPEEQIRYYTDYIRVYPDNPSGYLNRGMAYMNSKLWSEAEADFSEVIKLDKKDWFALRQRGYVRKYMREFEPALQDFLLANEIAPMGLEDYVGIGTMYEMQGKLDQAALYYRKQLLRDDNNPIAYAALAGVEMLQGNLDTARRDANTAVYLSPSPESYYQQLLVSLASFDGKMVVRDAKAYLDLSRKLSKHEHVDRHLGLVQTFQLIGYKILGKDATTDGGGKVLDGETEFVKAFDQALTGHKQAALQSMHAARKVGTQEVQLAAMRMLPTFIKDAAPIERKVMKNPTAFFISQIKTAKWNPKVKDDDNSNCGPACLSMAMKCFKKEFKGLKSNDPEALVERTRFAMTRHNDIYSGTDFFEVLQGARTVGLQAARFTDFQDVDGALRRGEVVMAAGNSSNEGAYGRRLLGFEETYEDMGHFILVIGKQGNDYVVCDPGMPVPHILITKKELESYWNFYTEIDRGGVALWN